MRRTLLIAAWVMWLALQVSAQHASGHGGGGHGGGFGGHSSFGGGGFGGHAGFGGGFHSGGHGFGGSHAFSGGHYYGGPHSYSGRSFIAPRSYGSHANGSMHSRANLPPEAFNRGPAPGSFHSSRGASRAFNHGGVHSQFRSFPFFRSCWGYGCGLGWGWGWGYPYLWGGIDPYWWWDNDDSGSPYDSGYNPGPYDNDYADQMNGAVPWRPPDNADQDTYERSAPPSHEEEESSDPLPATVLVFRDQHKQEVQNYAIVGQTLWAFAPQRTQKIPLSDLDIPATTKANDDRGVTFRIPAAAPAPTSTPLPPKPIQQITS